MGYYAHSEESDFLILREKKELALKAILEMGAECATEDDLCDALKVFGFEAVEDAEENITELYYEENKIYIDELDELMSAIAPFVEQGSFISFRGEDSSAWAYYFDGSSCKEYSGETVFPGMPEIRPRRSA